MSVEYQVHENPYTFSIYHDYDIDYVSLKTLEDRESILLALLKSMVNNGEVNEYDTIQDMLKDCAGT